MAFLTDQTLTTGVTLSHLIHVVDPFDTSQGNLAGSSYKATIEQVLSGFTGTTLYEVGTGTDSTQRVGISSTSSGNCSVVSGGFNNTVLGDGGFIGGGGYNTSDGTRSVITGGGGSCPALGNKTLCNYNFIGGGIQNIVNGTFSSIVGGGSISLANGNTINSCYSTIVGGCRNLISHDFSTVIGSNITTQSACTVHVNNLLIKDTPPQDQTATDYLVRDTISGMVKYKTIPGPTVYGLFAQTGNSTVISATTVESTLINGGSGTLTVPANSFSIGDSFRADFGGLISSKNADTIRIRVKAGSIVLADSGTQTMNGVTNDVWQLSVNFTVRQIGPAGVASIVSLGVYHTTKQSSGVPTGFAFNTVNNTTFDTTISNTLNVTVEFSSNSPLNQIYSDIFVLNKIY